MGINRGHWYNFNRQFYDFNTLNFNKETKQLDAKVVTLNIFERLKRWLRIAHKETTSAAFFEKYKSIKENALKTDPAIRFDKILQARFPSFYKRLETVYETTDSKNLSEKLFSDDNNFACLRSTTKYPDSVRKNPPENATVGEDYALFDRKGDIAMGAVGNYHKDFRAPTIQLFHNILKQAKNKFPFTFDQRPDDVRNKLKAMLGFSESGLKPRSYQSAATLLFYEVISDGKGKKRVVGVNIGDGAMWIFDPKKKELKLISEPHHRISGSSNNQVSTEPYTLGSILGEERNHLFFDHTIDEDSLLICASGGLLKAVPFSDDTQKKQLLTKLQTKQLTYLDKKSEGLDPVREAENEIAEAKTEVLNTQLKEDFSKMDTISPEQIVDALFSFADKVFDKPNGIREIETLIATLEKEWKESASQSKERLLELHAEHHDNPTIKLPPGEWDRIQKSDEKLSKLRENTRKLNNAIKENKALLASSHLESDAVTIQAVI